MTLKNPVQITSFLLPGVRIGQAEIAIEYHTRREKDGRTRYKYTLDLGDGKKPIIGSDLRSGFQGGNLREGLNSLLTFLGAESEEGGMFPARVSEWAKQNPDEISIAALEVESVTDCIVE